MRPVFCFEIMTAPQFLDMAPRLHIVPEFAVPTPLLAAWVGGQYGDPSGRGRRCGRPVNCTDRDTGRYADGVGRGRRCGRPNNVTDGDSGSNADPGGNGRGPHRVRPTGLTTVTAAAMRI